LDQPQNFIRPNAFERLINRFYGALVGFGLGLQHNYLLQVRGRKSGKIYSTPVNVLNYNHSLFLVATRGYTEWARNALAAQEVTLKKGRVLLQFKLRPVADEEKPEILRVYLGRFRATVGRFFPVKPDAPPDAFAGLANRYPVFELIRP
jgi:deazaflavin-dependent oxidoreductase (nitroreductase family)